MIARYQIHDYACTTAASHLCHLRCVKDGTAALLKVPNAKHSLPAQLSRFQHEYDALRSNAIPGLIKPVTPVNEGRRPADREYCRFPSGSTPALRPRTATMSRQKHVDG